MSTIPADLFVADTPSVLSTGGSGLVLNGLLLSPSTRVPIGTVMSFSGGPAVSSYFGATSAEALFAQGGTNAAGTALGSGYFGGFQGATILPGTLLVAQYNVNPVSAYLRGGNISALPLTTLQGYNGLLGVVIDGTPVSATFNLSGVTSFTNAAQLIETDLAISGVQGATFTGAITGNVLTVTSPTGTLSVGDKITGATVAASTFISSFGTATGGAGTYNLTTTAGSPISAEAMVALLPAVQFDSVSGAFVITSGTTGVNSTLAFATGPMAADLLLTSATGAVLSQGAAAASPAAFMNNIVATNRNWVTFAHCFNPDASGFANKLAFAEWNNGQNKKFMYVPFDTDQSPLNSVPATASFGFAVTEAGISGTSIQSEPLGDQNLSAFVCGAVASINFNQAGGRTSFAFRKQAGLVPGVTTGTAAINLGGNPQSPTFDPGNGYNYYGAIATANESFIDYQRGFVSGPYMWIDTYINQIAINAEFQLDLMELQENSLSIPFTTFGDAQVEAALADSIQKYVTFGAIVPGVTLSSSQIAAVNAAAGGLNIAPTIQNQGWYLYIPASSPTTRQSRGPRLLTFFYADGGSIQSFSFSSVVAL